MYCTSTHYRLLNEGELISLERRGLLKLPQSYRSFMKVYGSGTYGGAICINRPDFNLLEKYAEYDFWKYDNSPIRWEQMKECAVIGNSIDGDYIAVHPDADGYILLPRHSDQIGLFPDCDENFFCILKNIARFLYNEDPEDYFEPVGNDCLFLHYTGKYIYDFIDRFKAAFQNDYLVENEYTCIMFLTRMGGYARVSLSKPFEIAVTYSDYGLNYFERVKAFLKENSCA
ncbi:MAG: SMI1/KNR4 family protein [Blautia sp.]|nr:SMI1/KNR4 family protein [Blautia sp.]